MKRKSLVLTAVLAVAVAGALRAQQPKPNPAASVWASTCASCHGVKGTPSPSMAHAMGVPDLAAASTAAVPDSVLREAILNGKGHTMPAYKSRLTAAQVAELVAYIRTFKS